MILRFVFVFVLFFLTLFSETSTLQDDAKIDVDKMKKALDQLEKKQDLEELNGFSLFERDLGPATASEEEAVKFYETCARKVEV
ncbi:MAG: hypothetical protein V4507_09075, partial [Verrucomicrobiota bacterium]